jgi:RNA polymerase sigma-70 factor (ECF subfamily)
MDRGGLALAPQTRDVPPAETHFENEGLHKTLLRDMSGLKAQLTRVTRDADLAADMLQDAIVTALQKLRAGEIEHRSQLDGYVYRVALNHLRNHRRKDKAPVSDPDSVMDLVDSTAEARPARAIEGEEWARLVRRLMRQLSSPRDREVLVRFYLKEEDRGALCQSLGLTDLQFNRVIFRARERFRDLLEHKGFGKSDLFAVGLALLLGL